MDERDEQARERAAQAIFNERHPSPNFNYSPGADRWARMYADAAIDAYQEATNE